MLFQIVDPLPGTWRAAARRDSAYVNTIQSDS
jgi:hypothetical protein